MFKPSLSQNNILKYYLDNPYSNIGVQATAGSGKSTLIRWLLTQTANRNILVLAFNKSTSEEMSKRVPVGVRVNTLHSLGFSVLRKSFTKVIPDQWVVYKYIINNKIPIWSKDWTEEDRKKTKGYVMGIKEIVDFYRIGMCSSFVDFKDFMSTQGKDHYTLSNFNRAMEVLNEMNNIYVKSRKNETPIDIDFISMLYLPIHLKLRFPKFREVFTDESQDFSKLMWAIAEKCVSARGRLIVVGDSSQSIYSFTGASPEIFLNKISEKNTKLLPLPVSYRCSRAVCDEARKFCDNKIIPHESNKEGNVGEANFEYAEWGDFVLCRTNKPLMAAYYTLLAQGTKCYIKDKDLGDALIKEISPFLKYNTMTQYRSDAEKSINMLVSKLLQKGVERPHRTIKYKELKEKKDLIIYLGEINQDSPRKLYDSLRDMFSDKKDRGVALMTIHKSKGLEAGTVFLICPDLIPSKYASTPEMIQQEKNLMFVAVTRAINNFFYDRSFTSKDI